MTTERGIPYDPDEWPHGLRCCECAHLFEPGDEYSERLVAMTHYYDEPASIIHIICTKCAAPWDAP